MREKGLKDRELRDRHRDLRDREKTVYETGIIQGQYKTGKRKGQDRNKKGYKIRLKKFNAGWGRVVSSSTIWTSIVCLYNSIRSFNYETIKDNKSLGIIVVVFIFLFVQEYFGQQQKSKTQVNIRCDDGCNAMS